MIILYKQQKNSINFISSILVMCSCNIIILIKIGINLRISS